MFSLRGLVSSINKSNDSEYIQLSSLIEKGSVLDRRKYIKKERRITPERRKQLSDAIVGREKRIINERRLILKRRLKENVSKLVEDQDCKKEKLTAVETLIKGQNSILVIAYQLSISAQLMNYSALDKRIQKLITIIKGHKSSEEKQLQNFSNTATNRSNKKIKKLLTELSPFVACDNALEILEKYQPAEINENNVEIFIQDMDKLSDVLGESLKLKQKSLYEIYKLMG